MKKPLHFISIFFFVFIVQTASVAQCTYFNAVSDVTLNCTTFGPNKTGVAYNPLQNLYYSVTAGSASYNMETFTSSGGSAVNLAVQGADYRGYWWNPTVSKPEGNTLVSGGIYNNTLNGSGYPTGVVTGAGTGGQPSIQSAGALNLANTNEILYYNSGNLYRYNRSTGAIISTTPITGLPGGSNINLYGIIYTGVAGSEVGIYDYTNKRVLFIDYTTGAYSNYCQLPGTAPTPGSYNFAYANNRVFLYDQANTRWIGYPISGATCSGEALQFAGGYAEKSAFTLGSTWSVEAWIKPTGVSSTFWKSVLAQDYWNSAQGFALRIVSDSVGIECPIGAGASTYINAFVTANVWTHVAATYGNGVLTFYKDGIFVGARTLNYTNATLPFHVGARNGNNGSGVIDAYTGVMDEVRVWNTLRSQCEIQTYMDAEIQSNATGLLGNYHFTQGIAGGTNTSITLLDDATTAANDGTLTGFTLTGAINNFVQPGAVTSNNFNANPVPTGSITVTGNGNSLTNNQAVTSATNNTNFGSNGLATRSFVITNTGAGAMKIGKPYMTGANATDFTVTTSPSTLIASAASTTFVVTFSPTAFGSRSASVNININDCSLPVFKYLVDGSSTQGAALAFAGSHTLTIPHSTAFNITSAITLETWVKATYAGEAYITTKNDDSWYLAISGGGGTTGKASFFLNGVTPGGWLTGTSVISDGNWHHVAATYDGSMMRLYVDGNLEAQIAQAGAVSTGINSVRIGSRTNATPLNFTGTMDEMRIWNTARSQCEIQRYMNCEIPTTFTGLVANYHFNQGTAGGTNTGVNTLTSSAGGNTGTLSNFALTGTVSNWVAPGAVITGSTAISANNPTLTVTGNGNPINDGATSASATNFTDFGSLSTRTFVISNAAGHTLTIGTPYITGANASEYTVTTVPAASINPGGTSSFVVTFNASAAGTRTATINFVTNDCAIPVFNFVVSGTAIASAALKFDGANDYIKRNETNFGSGDFCIELWIKPASFFAPNGDIYLVTNRSNDFSGTGHWYVLGIDPTGQLKLNMGTANLAGGLNLIAPASLTLNTWQHVAVTRTGTLLALYVNGVVVASGSDLGARDLNSGYNIVTFGAWGAPLGQRYFNGEMDDIRLWNTNRTQCQIQANMRAEILTTAANLIGNYHFNQGVASGNNTGQANLTDVSASATNGIFNNFALTGATSNFISPGAVTTGSTTLASVTPSITVTGSLTAIINGATTASTLDLTNFNGAVTRTFVIDNTGTNTLNIGTPFLTGANASEFSITGIPGGAVTTGTTSFIVAFTPTATGTRSATVNFFNNDCSKPIFSFVVQGSGIAAAALDFSNASSDVISVPNVTLNNQSFTIEFWAKRNNTNDDNYIVGQGTPSPNNALHIGFRNSNQFTFSFHTSDLNVSNPACTDGLYHHWACVYKSGVAGLNRLIYLDGKLIAADNASNYTGSGTFYIGNHTLGTPDYFNGSIDELRIWNSVRSQCDIQAYKNCEIATTATGLTANYHFNQGVASGGNSAVTTLTDATGSGHNGTLTSFVLTGPTSNWVATGGVISGSVTLASTTASITVTGNGNGITNGSTSPLATNFTSFGSATTRTFVIDNTGGGTLNIDSLYFTGANAAQFSKPSTLLSLTTGTIALVITYTPSAGTQSATVNILTNDCSKPVFSFVIDATSTVAAALNFDGSSDNVSISSNISVGNYGIAPFTLEAWIYPTSLAGSRSIIRKDGDYNLLLNGGLLQADAFPGGSGGGAFKSATATTSVLVNQWSHVAAVWNGSTFALYVNGLGVTTTTGSGSAAVSSWPSLGVSSTYGQAFQGSMDEVRFWKTGRTQCELQQYMSCEIATSSPSLMVNFHFNEGFANITNTLNTVTDFSGNNNTGTLSTFALTGATSNWVIPGGVTSGSITPAVVPAQITVLGNGVGILNGAATPTLSNWTDFGVATLRSFVIDNTGTGTLNVNAPYLTGGNASDFSITANPANAVTTGTTSLIVSFTPSALGTRTAIVNIPNNDCSKPTFSFVIGGTVLAGAALNLDGTNDFLSRPVISTQNNNITLQARVYLSAATPTNQVILYNGNTSTSGYGFFATNTRLIQILYGGSGIYPTGYTLPLNQWTALALVIETSGTIRFYANGLQVYSTSTGLSAVPNGSFLIGASSLGGEVFNGSVDEVLFWTRALSQCEIQTNIDSEIPTTASSLIANYHFNQGLASLNNSTVTSVTDASGNGNSLTLNYFTLTGTSSNWIAPGAVVSGYTVTTPVSSTIAVTGNGTAVPNGSTGTSVLNNTDFNGLAQQTFVVANTGGNLYVNNITLSGANASHFSVTSAQSFSLGNSNSNFLTIAYTPTVAGTSTAVVIIKSSNCAVPDYSFVITGSVVAGAALSFDGINDFITTPGMPLNNQPFTVEFWAKRTNTANYNIALSQGNIAPNAGLHIGFQTGNFFMMGFYSNDLVVPHSDALWHHWACVYKTGVASGGKNRFIYRDGVLIASDYSPSNYTGTGIMNIGKTIFSTDYFNGSLDEMRIWNVDRTQCEIQSYMNSEIQNATPGLLANYHFNQGISPGSNTAVTTLTDATGSYNGTLNNFTLAGSVSNWTAPGGVTSGNTLVTVPSAEINILGNGTNIADGTSTTSLADNTNFGGACVNSSIVKTFTIQNTGSTPLTIASLMLAAGSSSAFAINDASTTIAAGGNATFAVTFTSSTTGVKNAIINVISSDCDESLYDFAITGTVNPAPFISTGNGLICQGQSYTLSATGANTYTYSSGPVVSPLSTTNYSITGTSIDGCVSSNTAVSQVVVDAIPSINISGSGTICAGGFANYTASGANTYTWSTGATGTLVSLSPTLTSTYTVTGAYANGCANTAVKTLSVYNTPTVTVNSGTICYGQSFTIAPSGAVTYSYVNGGPVISPTVTTTYSVTGTSALGCTSFPESISTVSVISLPAVSISDYSICSGSSATLNPSGALSYTYQGGSAIVNPVSTTSYTVAGVNASGCVNTATSVVTVNAAPLLTITVPSPSICTGVTTTLTANGASSYSWNTGATTQTISVSPATNTVYSITGTDANGCTGSVTQAIVINPLPTITIPNGAICPGNSYTLVPSGAFTYSFSSGSDVIFPATTGTYAVLGTSSLGCVASTSAIATVSVVNTLTIAISGNTTICEGQTTTLTASGASSYSWTNGDLTSTTSLSPTVTTTYTVYGASGTCSNNAVVSVSVNAAPTITVNSGAICAGASFTLLPSGAISYTYSGGSNIVSPLTNTAYSVSGTNALGCVNTVFAISTITVNALPIPTITASNYTVCSGETTTLTVTGVNSYTWSNALQTNTIGVIPAAGNSYSVSGTGSNGCVSSASLAITVNPLPTITIPNGAICPGNSYTLVPSGAFTYTYSSGSDVISPVTTGTYAVLGTSSLGCVASTSAIATVSVVNTLTIAVSGNTTICEGQTTTLTAGGATSYTWTNGALTSTTALSPTITSTYTVYGVSGTCSNNAVVSVSVNTVPTITVNSGAICAGNSFTMLPGGAVTYTYSGGSNVVSPAANASYSVSGTNAAGCVSTVSAISNVTVNALPAINIAASSASMCEGAAITLTASGTNSYVWSNSLNTTTLNSAVISVTPVANVTYSAAGTDLNGCVGTFSQSLTVSPLPTITVAGGVVCPGGSFTFNPQGAATYSYSGGQIITPAATASYSISGTSAAGCVASNSAIVTVSVISTLTITVTGNTIICAGQQASLSAGGASTYSWSTGATTSSITLSPIATTSYTVFGMSGSCIDNALVTVSVNALPTVSANGGTVCSGSSFTLVPAGALTYSYSGGSDVVYPTVTTSYSITGTDINGCVSSTPAIAEVTVAALPLVVAVISSPTVCAGSSTSLTASGSAISYTWSTLQTALVITVTPSASTLYTLTGTAANGCENTATVNAAVSPLASLVVSADHSVSCNGASVLLSASGADTYTWSSGHTNSTVIVTPSVITSYSVSGSVAGGCDGTAMITLSVSATPTLLVSGADSVCVGSPFDLSVSGASSYTWSTGQITPTISIEPLVNTTYTVTGVNTEGCSATATTAVILKSCERHPIKPVNAITPNGDGLNDSWIITNIEEYPQNKVLVFNRWGVEVLNLSGYNNDDKVWPSKGQASNLPTSTYFYIIDLKDGSKPIKGWVELIKP